MFWIGLFFYLPIFFCLSFLIELRINQEFATFIFFSYVVLYLASFLAVILFTVLKFINIKYKSNKIKEINEILFIGFYIFISTYISGIGMGLACKYLYWNHRIENVENFNYDTTGTALGYGDSTLRGAAGIYQLWSGPRNWGPSSNFDDPADQYYINQGIDWYENNY